MIEEDKLLKMIVCSHHSASQDTLRNCTKCRGILIMRALRALSRTESEEASSRSYCAQLTIYRPLSADRMVDGARVFLLRTTMRGDYSKVQKGRTDHCTAVSALTSEPPAHAPFEPSFSQPQEQTTGHCTMTFCCTVQRSSVLVVKRPEVPCCRQPTSEFFPLTSRTFLLP
jgi:hypothetical protein